MEQSGGNQAWVLSEGRSASSDYYIFPRLHRDGYHAELVDTRQAPTPALLGTTPACVVISRYLPKAWLGPLRQFAKQGVRIVYFMDDDLFDWRALSTQSWGYRFRLMRKALLQSRRLRRLCGEFWVSTSYLAEKYPQLKPELISPYYETDSLHAAQLVRICYHGTASHRREILWLREVIAGVQSQCDYCHFELFGDEVVKRLYRGIPRVSVMHAMSWPDYLAWTSSESRDIALAPLLEDRFNAARGPTKFFDYTRMQAVGLYSNVAPYQGFIRDGVDGVLLDSRPQSWIDAITQLAGDADRRTLLSSAAQARLQISLEAGS